MQLLQPNQRAVKDAFLLLTACFFSLLVFSQSNNNARVYLLFNYNEGSPFHARTGDTIPISEGQRIVGPRVFTLPGCANRVTHVHNIMSSFCGFRRPWDDDGRPRTSCTPGGGTLPCNFIDSNGALDTAYIISNAEEAASQTAYYRFPQDVIDGTVNHLQIDYEWGVPHDSLWGWYYQTQSKFKDASLNDPYQFSITDSLQVTREQYNAIHRIHWYHFTKTLKEIDTNYRIGFYSLPAMNRPTPVHRDKVRYQEPGSIMPDTVFNHIMDHYMGLDDIEVFYHQNYVNLKPGNYFANNLDEVAPFTKENALSNKQKFHNDPRTASKPFAVGFWLAFWQWDSLYAQKMQVFEETLDSLASNNIRQIWLSSGSWKTDGTNTELLEQLDLAGIPLDTFWTDIATACKNTILKGTCNAFSPPQKTRLQKPQPEAFSLPDLALRIRPNPTHATTTLQWESAQAGHTLLQIFDARGQPVRTLVDAYRQAGKHTEVFQANLPPGMYYCLLRVGNRHTTRPLMITE